MQPKTKSFQNHYFLKCHVNTLVRCFLWIWTNRPRWWNCSLYTIV